MSKHTLPALVAAVAVSAVVSGAVGTARLVSMEAMPLPAPYPSYDGRQTERAWQPMRMEARPMPMMTPPTMRPAPTTDGQASSPRGEMKPMTPPMTKPGMDGMKYPGPALKPGMDGAKYPEPQIKPATPDLSQWRQMRQTVEGALNEDDQAADETERMIAEMEETLERIAEKKTALKERKSAMKSKVMIRLLGQRIEKLEKLEAEIEAKLSELYGEAGEF